MTRAAVAISLRTVTGQADCLWITRSRLWIDSQRQSFFPTQEVDAICPGGSHVLAGKGRVFTVPSPGCAQSWRRVFTRYPQGCAHDGLASGEPYRQTVVAVR